MTEVDGEYFDSDKANTQGQQRWAGLREARSEHHGAVAANGDGGLLAYADEPELQGQSSAGQQPFAQSDARPLRNGSWWADAEWIVSPLDGKARRAKPSLPFLVDGLPGRVDLWRVGGNAISPILAAEVIAAFLESEADMRASAFAPAVGGPAPEKER